MGIEIVSESGTEVQLLCLPAAALMALEQPPSRGKCSFLVLGRRFCGGVLMMAVAARWMEMRAGTDCQSPESRTTPPGQRRFGEQGWS